MSSAERGRRGVLIIGIVGLVLVVALAIAVGFIMNSFNDRAPTSSHPAASLVAREYLDAIATGDGDRARELDARVLEGDRYSSRDVTTFVSTVALSAAVERISDISVDDVSSTEKEAAVDYSFTLAGKSYDGRFNLLWDATTEQWMLDSSLAQTLIVSTFVDDRLDSERPPFTLGPVAAGVHDEQSNDIGLGSAVYPGVYQFDVDIDPASLRDAGAIAVSQQLVVPPGVQLVELEYQLLAE